ncbi:hypothetical protein KC878_03455 [Candidatus Saccharibacteria bacterium]|nr:hypothetical protein [Candidatus Saccharibacteria bacterium]MCB9820969.1 hypothetical protein [Candidatus Nomurabacteria bacterium]
MTEQSALTREPEKPERLFVGSSQRLSLLDPAYNRAKPNEDVPNFVYASSDMGYALCFAFDWAYKPDDPEYQLSRFTDGGAWRLAVDTQGIQRMRNTPGYLYELDSKQFRSAVGHGTPNTEWVSEEIVTPLSTREVNVLDEVMASGVQVYLTDESILRAMAEDPQHGFSAYRQLDQVGACINQSEKPESYVSLEAEACSESSGAHPNAST